ncbi:MAG: hypothetical protein V3U27_02570 [Candidatus Tectomicrobia bacterium]
MIVETEPNGFLMVRYKLYFNQQRPDPEDPWVLAYFQEHGLQPRRELQEEHAGIRYKLLHFGQCYLGRHVGNLGALYQKGVEHSVLAVHLQEFLPQATDATVREAAAGLEETAMHEVTGQLAEQLYEEARFETGEDHNLAVSIDANTVVRAFLAAYAGIAEADG